MFVIFDGDNGFKIRVKHLMDTKSESMKCMLKPTLRFFARIVDLHVWYWLLVLYVCNACRRLGTYKYITWCILGNNFIACNACRGLCS